MLQLASVARIGSGVGRQPDRAERGIDDAHVLATGSARDKLLQVLLGEVEIDIFHGIGSFA